MIDHYQIYVDGVLKATIPAGDRTKALVEGVDSSMVIEGWLGACFSHLLLCFRLATSN